MDIFHFPSSSLLPMNAVLFCPLPQFFSFDYFYYSLETYVEHPLFAIFPYGIQFF